MGCNKDYSRGDCRIWGGLSLCIVKKKTTEYCVL